MSKLITFILFSVFWWYSSSLAADDSIHFDEKSGNYIIKYEVDGVIKKAVLVPANNVSVTIIPKLSIRKSDNINYRYKVRLDSKKGLPLATLSLDSRPVIEGSLESPHGWKSIAFKHFESDTMRIGWMNEAKQQEHPKKGYTVIQFSMESDYLPGFGDIEVSGKTPILRFEGYGPSYEVAQQLKELRESKVGGANFISAVPTISVSQPFNLVHTVEEFHAHLVNAKKDARLSDYISDEIISDLQALLNSARSGDKNTARRQLKELLLKNRDHKGRDFRHSHSEKRSDDHYLSGVVNEVIEFNVRYMLQKIQKRHF